MSASSFNNSSKANGTEQVNSSNGSNQTDRLIQLAIIWIIIIVGLSGNSFVVAVVTIFNRMKTTTNYLLVNVAAADITTLCFTAIHLVTTRRRSSTDGALISFLCKFVYTNTITIVTLLVTALTLTLVAIERYHALVKPFRIIRRLTTDNIAYAIAGIWAVAIVMTTPLFISLDHRPNSRNFCSPGDAFNEMRIYVFCLVVTLTLIPFLSIAFCYSQIIVGLYCSKTICRSLQSSGSSQERMKEKKRLVTLLILLTAVFFVAFVPYGVVMILKFSSLENLTAQQRHSIGRLQTGVQFLTLLNCSVNPFIYVFQSCNYRLGFKFIIKKIFCRDTAEEALELRVRASL